MLRNGGVGVGTGWMDVRALLGRVVTAMGKLGSWMRRLRKTFFRWGIPPAAAVAAAAKTEEWRCLRVVLEATRAQ